MEKKIVSLENVDISLQSLLTTLHLDEDDEYIDDIIRLHKDALRIARPVAIYSPLVPELRDEKVWLNGVKLEEPFVYKMLKGNDLVIPYVASCGPEIDAWTHTISDFFEQFVTDTFKQMSLSLIREELFREVKEKHIILGKNLSTINPGSLIEWPISGQIPLFNILGSVKEDIGVELLDSLLMSPTKSVSGIIFQTDEEYHNCQLCPKENCPGRCAPYIGD